MNHAHGPAWTLGAPVRAVLLAAIRLYQLTLSGAFGARCKYYPSCSSYAAEAISRHGAIRGSCLAGWRLLRCNPLSLGGVDHVPHHKSNTYDDVLPPATSPYGPADRDRAEA